MADALARFGEYVLMVGYSWLILVAAAAWLAIGVLRQRRSGRPAASRRAELAVLFLGPFVVLLWGAVAFGWGSETDRFTLHTWAAYATHLIAISQLALSILFFLGRSRDWAYSLPTLVTALVLLGQAWVISAFSVVDALV